MHAKKNVAALAGFSLAVCLAPPLFGQDEDIDPPSDDFGEAADPEGGPAEADDAEDTVEAGTGAAATGDASADAAAITGEDDPSSPIEKPGQTYMFVGARYRPIVVPQFMMSLFGADGGTTVLVHGFGPEFGIRKDDFEYNLSIWYAGYFMDPTPFKGKDDGIQEWEHVESDMKVIYLTADFMWSAPFSPTVAFNYGIGAGIGFPFGDLWRREVYPPGGDSSIPVEDWQVCRQQSDLANPYCDELEKPEKTWADGGSKPIVFPWLVGQVGLRFKPHRNFVLRTDLLGFGTSGFFFTIGADYGL